MTSMSSKASENFSRKLLHGEEPLQTLPEYLPLQRQVKRLRRVALRDITQLCEENLNIPTTQSPVLNQNQKQNQHEGVSSSSVRSVTATRGVARRMRDI